jgi:hypothetical protein
MCSGIGIKQVHEIIILAIPPVNNFHHCLIVTQCPDVAVSPSVPPYYARYDDWHKLQAGN